MIARISWPQSALNFFRIWNTLRKQTINYIRLWKPGENWATKLPAYLFESEDGLLCKLKFLSSEYNMQSEQVGRS